jgi:hypothetical protein
VFSWGKDFNIREGALDSLDHATFLLALAEQHNFKFAEQDMASSLRFRRCYTMKPLVHVEK